MGDGGGGGGQIYYCTAICMRAQILTGDCAFGGSKCRNIILIYGQQLYGQVKQFICFGRKASTRLSVLFALCQLAKIGCGY